MEAPVFWLWGWYDWKSTLATGEFHCPRCDGVRPYAHERIRSWFDVFFIPILPLGSSESVKCQACGATYPEDVLGHESRDPRRAAAFRHALRRVAAEFMSDRDDAAERQAVQQALSAATGQDLGAAELEREIGSACADPRPLAQHLATLAGGLGEAEKEALVRTALAVARAKGPLRDAQRARLDELAGALRMSGAHLLGVLAQSGD
jgi:tellurite resistance protein